MAFGIGSLIAPIAGGLINSRFGGSDDKAIYNQPTLETVKSPWGPSVPAATKVLSEAERIYGEDGFRPIANELELLGRANLLGYAEGMLPELIGDVQTSWRRGLDPGLDPYVGAMIESAQQDLTQDYLRNVMPSIADRAQATGGYGGSRQGVAQGIAAEGLMEALGDVETRLLSDAYGKALGQQRAAWGAAPGMVRLGFMPAQTQQEMGDLYRQDLMQPAGNLMGLQQTTFPYFQAGFGETSQPNPAYQTPANQFLSGAAAGQQLWNDIEASFNAGSPTGGPLLSSSGSGADWLQRQMFG